MKCPHGINVKHKVCDRCREVAEVQQDRNGRSVQVRRERSDLRLEVDTDRLIEEWNAQPGMFHRQTVELADAVRDAKRAEAHRKLVYAEVELEVRKSTPQEHGLEKFTEGAIDSLILTDGRHKKAMTKQLDAEHAADVLKAAVEALRQRRDELSDQVKMHLSGLAAEPSVPEGGSRFVGEGKAARAFGRRKP